MRIVRAGRLFAELELDGLTVIALSDGHAEMPVERLRGPDGQDLTEDELADVPQQGGKLRLEVHAFLVRGAGTALLIDTGSGNAWQPTTGRLAEAMAEAGVDPDGVTDVALTHTHVDHIGGLVRGDGMPTFANLRRIFVPAEEIGLFRDEARMAPVLGLVVPLAEGDTLMRGVTAVGAPGHEVGHTAFLLEDRLLVWGDVVHVPSLQFARPEVTWAFDTDQTSARETRLRLLERVVRDGLMVAGAHLDFPPFGWVSRSGGGYAFQALRVQP
jgi:glyoxylase-like metal-dependent hydrolase (beta-lactamase superfamily II)